MRGCVCTAMFKRALHLATGHVAGVHDAPRAVPTLAREVELGARVVAPSRV